MNKENNKNPKKSRSSTSNQSKIVQKKVTNWNLNDLQR